MKVETIVVGYDGSSNADQALDAAAQLVRDDGVVHVVTAYDPMSDGEYMRLVNSLPDEFKQTVDVLSVPQETLRKAQSVLDARGVTNVAHLEDAKPAAAILDVAEDVGAGLIIVGSRGLGRATRFLRGSVSTRVASHAQTSFLVVHDAPASA